MGVHERQAPEQDSMLPYTLDLASDTVKIISERMFGSREARPWSKHSEDTGRIW